MVSNAIVWLCVRPC